MDRSNRTLFKKWWRTVDHPLLFAIGALILIGALMVTTASPAVAERLELDSFYFTRRQFLFLALGGAIIFSISLLEPKNIRRLSSIGYVICLFLLVLVLFVGDETKGSTRWLNFPFFAIQPSEFSKPFFVVVCAWMFSEKLRDATFPGFILAGGIFASFALMLFLQPNISVLLMVTVVWVGQFFLAGLSLLTLGIFALVGIAFIVLAYFLFSHVAARFDKFLHPDVNETYQVSKSLEALSGGGFFGRGPGEGIVKKAIPDSHTDFIFSVLGEEMGLVVVILVIGIYAFITIYGLMRLYSFKDPFKIIAGAGILMSFGLQAFINMGVAVKLIPTTGMTLPFISYGGSSIFASSISIGIFLALTRKRYDAK
jgi:cell division protein FtsW